MSADAFDAVAADASAPAPKGRFHCDETPDGVEIETPYIAGEDKRAAARSGDWSWLLAEFDLDPASFAVDESAGGVRISKWQQSRRLDNGDRDIVWLYSYRARFKRIVDVAAQVDAESTRKWVRSWKPLIRKTLGNGLGAPATFFVGWADWQIGKPDSNQTTERVYQSIETSLARIKDLRRIGRNIEAVLVADMGDPGENTAGHYAAQPYLVDLNLVDQVDRCIDLHLNGIRAFAAVAEVHSTFCLCNHMENRNGDGKQFTDDSDNWTRFIGIRCEKHLRDRPDFDHVRFTIPRAEMTVQVEASGVQVAMTHGHKMPGAGDTKELGWLRGESIRLLRDHGREPRLWMTAHRHHYTITDFGPWTRIQMPSLDAGSKYYTDTSGKWATPGTFTCLIGEHDAAGGPLSGNGTGFSDEFVIVPSV